MNKKRTLLLSRKLGDVLSVLLGDGLYCYIRKYRLAYGILPFFSENRILKPDALPTVEGTIFFDVWQGNDMTAISFVGGFAFGSLESSLGTPAYEAPDAVEPYFRIHGSIAGVPTILKPMNAEDVVGLRILRRYRPNEFSDFISPWKSKWPVISNSDTA